MRYTYNTQNTCASQISFDIDGEQRVTNVEFQGGCNGNLKAICTLVEGQKAGDIIAKCGGILCGRRPTSCADQFSLALQNAQKELLNA